MNRRQFLTRAALAISAVAAPAALIEALTPKRTIFLPPAGGLVGSGGSVLGREQLLRMMEKLMNPPVWEIEDMYVDMLVHGTGVARIHSTGRVEHVPLSALRLPLR